MSTKLRRAVRAYVVAVALLDFWFLVLRIREGADWLRVLGALAWFCVGLAATLVLFRLERRPLSMSKHRFLTDEEEAAAVLAVADACHGTPERLYLATEELQECDQQKVTVYVVLKPDAEVAFAIDQPNAQRALAALLPGRWCRVLRYDKELA